MPRIKKEQFWLELVNYYFDHVYQEDSRMDSIYDWLETVFDARSSTTNMYLEFPDDAKLNWFVLRWS